MHEWMVDNGFTPHLVVDATREDAEVPREHVKDGKIILNVSYSATRDLKLGNDAVTFEARFGGTPRRLAIPIGAVLGIYARETGQGMLFADDGTPGTSPPSGDNDGPPPATPPDRPPTSDPPRPKLKVVK
jgi:stringent starvation protein B